MTPMWWENKHLREHIIKEQVEENAAAVLGLFAVYQLYNRQHIAQPVMLCCHPAESNA